MTPIGASRSIPHRGTRGTVEPDLLLPDPDPVQNAPPEPDYVEG